MNGLLVSRTPGTVMQQAGTVHSIEGSAGLGDRRNQNAGAKSLLHEEDKVELNAVLAEPPADGGLWTGPKVAAWMSARLGRKIWPQRGWDYLQKLGYSSQDERARVHRRRHAKAASAAEQEAFKRGSRARWASVAPRIPSGRSRSGRLMSIVSV